MWAYKIIINASHGYNILMLKKLGRKEVDQKQ